MVQCKCKNYHKCEKDYSRNPGTRISENSKYLKSVADISLTTCDEIAIVMDSITTKKDKYCRRKFSGYCFR